MPYIPPHLRPGYVHKEVKKPDFTGKIHWPTNVNSQKENNIMQPEKIYHPRLGIVSKKSSLKLTKPIVLNSKPLAIPSMRIGHSKFNRAVRRHISRKFRSKKKVTRRRTI